MLRQNFGIQLEIDSVESAQGFAKRKENKYSVFHVSLAGYDPGYSANLLWKTGGTINFSQANAPKIAALVQAQSEELDDEKRGKIFDDLINYVLLEKKLVLPVGVEYHNSAAHKRVQNIGTSFDVLRKYPGPQAYDLWLKK